MDWGRFVFVLLPSGPGPEGVGKQAQVHGLGHRRIPGVIRVQVIAAVECRVEPVRPGRITQCALEVDNAVERARGSDPFIDGAALFPAGGLLTNGFWTPARGSIVPP
jgi:hypothetical protein